jgi:ZIP family zinc transporter
MTYGILRKPVNPLIEYPGLLVLGAFAGLTIFLGLPVGVIQRVGQTKKGFLNALAIGILIFLTVDVLSHAWDSVSYAAAGAFAGRSTPVDAALDLIAMFGGIAVGLLGLTLYGRRYMRGSFVQPPITNLTSSGGRGNDTIHDKQQLQLVQQVDAYKLSTMIAIGIGAHNFSEGLAIGQSYASGAIGLAMMLVIGFAAHNATEGFGIVAPLTGLSQRPTNRFLLLAGLLGGGPTFLGTALGGFWASTLAYVFFLAIAGGALVYVSMLMYNSARKQITNDLIMLGFFVGLSAGFITDLLISIGGA